MTTLTVPLPKTGLRLRPITLAILAMGGEGGGVLADWVVAMAESHGYFAQNTSVAGVAQRTGATVYYVELFPRSSVAGPHAEPVLSTMPTPGEVDIVIASELMEAGRSIQRGFTTGDRTTLITSTSRVYSMPERTAMGDARIDSSRLLEAARASSKRIISADFAVIAESNQSVISAALFGALAGSGELPFERAHFEEAIRASGKGVAASLAAFAAGFEVSATPARPVVDITIGARPKDPEVEVISSAVGPRLAAADARISRDFPEPAQVMLRHGIKRTAEYQDIRYADEYLDRIARIHALETGDDSNYLLTAEAARYTALWMTYEDTIRVAFHKTRGKRFDRVGREARIQEAQMMQVREFLHPQVEEISDTLPTGLGRWLLRSRPMNALIKRITHKGIVIQTTSVWGFTVLYVLARLQPIRRRSLRFHLEQDRIEAWLAVIEQYTPSDPDLGLEIIRCQQVIKGYGDTHHNGMRNFNSMMAAVPKIADGPGAGTRLKNLRTAALADETGSKLQSLLAASA